MQAIAGVFRNDWVQEDEMFSDVQQKFGEGKERYDWF